MTHAIASSSMSFLRARAVLAALLLAGMLLAAGAGQQFREARAAGFAILIVYSDGGSGMPTLRAELESLPLIETVDVFDAQSATPALATLQAYDLVVVTANSAFSDPVALGDVVADYQDGGGVVVGVFAIYQPTWAIAGRWVAEGYAPYVTTGAVSAADAVTLGDHDPEHPLMTTVTNLDATCRVPGLALTPDAVEVAAYSSGDSAVAFKLSGATLAVGLTAYLGDLSLAGCSRSSQYARVIANALYWFHGAWPVAYQACLFAGSLSQVSPVSYDNLEPTVSCGRGQAIVLTPGDDFYACLYAGSLSQVGTSEPTCGRGEVIGLAAGESYAACLFAGRLSQVGASSPNCGRGSLIVLAGLLEAE